MCTIDLTSNNMHYIIVIYLMEYVFMICAPSKPFTTEEIVLWLLSAIERGTIDEKTCLTSLDLATYWQINPLPVIKALERLDDMRVLYKLSDGTYHVYSFVCQNLDEQKGVEAYFEKRRQAFISYILSEVDSVPITVEELIRRLGKLK